MTNLILLILCFIAGMLLHRFKRMPVNTPAVLNSFIIHVSMPALTLLYVHDLKISGHIGLMAAMGWIVFALSAVFFRFIGRRLDLPRRTVGALILTGGLCNTSYVGLPMIEAYYGRQGLAAGIIVDQLGSFLVLSTLGITFAGIYSPGRPTAGEMARRIFLFPPFIALMLALLLMPVEYPDWLTTVLKRIGDTLAPLVLFLLYAPLLGAHGQAIQITLFEAAMPPMITSAILATEHDLDPPLATLMVAMGLVISFVTLTGWWWLMRGV